MKAGNTRSRSAWVGKVLTLILLSLLALSPFKVQSEIYTWVDEQGRKHFGNRPPPEQNVKKLNVRPNVVSNPNRPANTKNTIVMYGASWCGVCKRARRYFKENNIPFKEYDIERSRKGRQEYNKLNGNGVPLIMIGNKRLEGFSPERFQALYQGS
jgi:glutaredoxin